MYEVEFTRERPRPAQLSPFAKWLIKTIVATVAILIILRMVIIGIPWENMPKPECGNPPVSTEEVQACVQSARDQRWEYLKLNGEVKEVDGKEVVTNDDSIRNKANEDFDRELDICFKTFGEAGASPDKES